MFKGPFYIENFGTFHKIESKKLTREINSFATQDTNFSAYLLMYCFNNNLGAFVKIYSIVPKGC